MPVVFKSMAVQDAGSYYHSDLLSNILQQIGHAFLSGASAFPIKAGGVLVVDGSNGEDVAASPNGRPFKTLRAALRQASANTVVWVMPGVYDISNGVHIPDGCCVKGFAQHVVQLQASVSSPTTLIQLGVGSAIESLQVVGHADADGAHLVGVAASPGAVLRALSITLSNATVSARASGNLVGVQCVDGPAPSDDQILIRDVDVRVQSRSLGHKRGVRATAPCQVFIQGLRVDVTATGPAARGSYVGVESGHSECAVMITDSVISARGGRNSSDILQSAPALANTGFGVLLGAGAVLANGTAGGKPLTSLCPTERLFIASGVVPRGEHYLPLDSRSEYSASPLTVPVSVRALVCGLAVAAQSRLHGSGPITLTLWVQRRGGAAVEATALSVVLPAGSVYAVAYNGSVELGAGDTIAFQVVSPGTGVVGLSATLIFQG